MIHYWSTSDIPVATHDLLWVSSAFCGVPRALPGKPGNTRHVIPNPVARPCPELSTTQPITNPWVGARSSPSLHQTVNLHCYTNHQTPHTYLSSANKKVLHLVAIQVPVLVLLVLFGGTPNFQYLTDLNPKQSNPTNKETTPLKIPRGNFKHWFPCVTWPFMRHMTDSPGCEPISRRPGLCCGMGEKERSCHCHSHHLNSPWPCKILKVDQRTSESSQAYFNDTVLHTNTHLGYDWTRNATYAQHRLCVFLAAGTHSLLMHVEHQVSPRQERKEETGNPTRAAASIDNKRRFFVA